MFLKFIFFLDIYTSLLKLMINYAKDSEREGGYLFSEYLCELVNVSLKSALLVSFFPVVSIYWGDTDFWAHKRLVKGIPLN